MGEHGMTRPANDNVDPGRHAGVVLRHLLRNNPHARAHFDAGLAYARAANPAEMDATLAVAGADAVARLVLREGADLTEAGLALGPYKTEIQARAWAAAKLECALSVLVWHPHRIERDTYNARLIERCKTLKAQNAALISKLVA